MAEVFVLPHERRIHFEVLQRPDNVFLVRPVAAFQHPDRL